MICFASNDGTIFKINYELGIISSEHSKIKN